MSLSACLNWHEWPNYFAFMLLAAIFFWHPAAYQNLITTVVMGWASSSFLSQYTICNRAFGWNRYMSSRLDIPKPESSSGNAVWYNGWSDDSVDKRLTLEPRRDDALGSIQHTFLPNITSASYSRQFCLNCDRRRLLYHICIERQIQILYGYWIHTIEAVAGGIS